MRISDWSSDVCSSDRRHQPKAQEASDHYRRERGDRNGSERADRQQQRQGRDDHDDAQARAIGFRQLVGQCQTQEEHFERSEEHTSELKSLMRISYAVFCLKKNKDNEKPTHHKKHTKPVYTTKV